MANADLEMIRSAAAQEVGFTACRSKLAEVVEKTMKAESSGWAGLWSGFTTWNAYWTNWSDGALIWFQNLRPFAVCSPMLIFQTATPDLTSMILIGHC